MDTTLRTKRMSNDTYLAVFIIKTAFFYERVIKIMCISKLGDQYDDDHKDNDHN